jgi:hypothetical protein
LNEGKKGHDTSTLDRTLQSSLVEHADLGTLACHDLRERREEAAQNVHILIINMLDVIVAEVALLLFLNGWV